MKRFVPFSVNLHKRKLEVEYYNSSSHGAPSKSKNKWSLLSERIGEISLDPSTLYILFNEWPSSSTSQKSLKTLSSCREAGKGLRSRRPILKTGENKGHVFSRINFMSFGKRVRTTTSRLRKHCIIWLLKQFKSNMMDWCFPNSLSDSVFLACLLKKSKKCWST